MYVSDVCRWTPRSWMVRLRLLAALVDNLQRDAWWREENLLFFPALTDMKKIGMGKIHHGIGIFSHIYRKFKPFM